jgi:hypothetical protein
MCLTGRESILMLKMDSISRILISFGRCQPGCFVNSRLHPWLDGYAGSDHPFSIKKIHTNHCVTSLPSHAKRLMQSDVFNNFDL